MNPERFYALQQRLLLVEQERDAAKAGWDSCIADLREAASICKGVEQEREHLMDLVRYARHLLHEDGLVSDEEFAALVVDSNEGMRVARLEAYDFYRNLCKVYKTRAEEAERRLESVWLVDKRAV